MVESEPISFHRLREQDAFALCDFYNGLSRESIRTFRPLGNETTLDRCREIARDNSGERDLKYDLVARMGERIVGWCFLWKLDSPEPTFGLGVADDCQGRGLGSSLSRRIMAVAAERGLKRVILTVVKDNHLAVGLYERLSFSTYGEFVGPKDGLTYLRMAASIRPVSP
jgi:ribosomal protein S18 acetylase RimI-like enzyme